MTPWEFFRGILVTGRYESGLDGAFRGGLFPLPPRGARAAPPEETPAAAFADPFLGVFGADSGALLSLLPRLVGDPCSAAEAAAAVLASVAFCFAAAVSSFCLMYFLMASLTPRRFLQAEQVRRVQGLDSVRSRMEMASALPESSYVAGSYL